MKFANEMRWLTVVVLIASLAVGPALAGAQENLPGKRWKVKYQAGSAPFLAGQAVNVLVGTESILLLGGNSREQSISVPDVSQISYDTARGRYVSRALAGTLGEMQSGADLVMYMYVMLPMAIVALPFKGTRHFVTIEWTEGRRHRAVVLRMKKNTAKAFLAELELATGVQPRNLDREREEFKQEQKRKSAPSTQEERAKSASTPGN
jgi:hypothetical protein